MINLMPPDMKEQIKFAKFNRVLVRYLQLVVVVSLALGAVFGGAIYWIGQQTTVATADAADKQATITQLNKEFVPQAKAAAGRLNAIKFVQSSQTHFSQVIADIAKVIPNGVTIDTLTLTGQDNVPVTVAITADSYNDALAFRNALITSPRIAGADLESITTNDSKLYQANVVIAFKPGEAR